MVDDADLQQSLDLGLVGGAAENTSNELVKMMSPGRHQSPTLLSRCMANQ